MPIEIDLNSISAGEMADLGAALGCTTVKQIQSQLERAQALSQDGDVPLNMLVPLMWLARRSVEPGLSLEQARNMPFTELMEGLTVPNVSGGKTAASSATSSALSARSTTTRRKNSGRSK